MVFNKSQLCLHFFAEVFKMLITPPFFTTRFSRQYTQVPGILVDYLLTRNHAIEIFTTLPTWKQKHIFKVDLKKSRQNKEIILSGHLEKATVLEHLF